MPTPSTTLIRVPLDLHAKLKELAHIRRVSMVDLVHGFVREAEATGELPANISTLRITLDVDQTPPRTILGNGATPLAVLTPADVIEFCDRLDTVLARGGSSYMALERWQVMIARVGTGIVIERQDPLPDPAAEPIRRSFNAAFAADLSARLRSTIPA